MDPNCPICRQPIKSTPRSRRRRQLLRQIYALERQILTLEQGSLLDVIQHQTPAPACTICSQAAPGKPGEPTPVAELVRPLQQRLDELRRELNRVSREE